TTTHTGLSIHVLFTAPAHPPLYTLSLHDALPIYSPARPARARRPPPPPSRPTTHPGCNRASTGSDTSPSAGCRSSRPPRTRAGRSEEHTSELQSRSDLVCRLLLEKKKKNKHLNYT